MRPVRKSPTLLRLPHEEAIYAAFWETMGEKGDGIEIAAIEFELVEKLAGHVPVVTIFVRGGEVLQHALPDEPAKRDFVGAAEAMAQTLIVRLRRLTSYERTKLELARARA